MFVAVFHALQDYFCCSERADVLWAHLDCLDGRSPLLRHKGSARLP